MSKSIYSGAVVPTPNERDPFKVIIGGPDGQVIADWPCQSRAEGEAQIVGALETLRQMAKEGP